MSSKLLLTALAGVAAVVVVAAPQDPSFEFPAAKHAGFDVPAQEAPQKTQTANSERVSVTFRNATVREVLDWLKDQGVSFVIGDDQVNKESHVSVNLNNQPITALMRALAGAWEGHWQKNEDIWVFHKGQEFFGQGSNPFNSDTAIATEAPRPFGGEQGVRTLLRPGQAPAATGPLKTRNEDSVAVTSESPVLGKLFKQRVGDGESVTIVQGNGDRPIILPTPMNREQQEAFQKAMKNMNDPKAWEEFSRSWENWAKDYEKNYQEFERNFKGKDFNFKLDEKQMKEIESQAKEMAKQGAALRKQMAPGANGFIYDGKSLGSLNQLDQKQIEQIRKQAAEMAKNAEQWRVTAPKISGQQWSGTTLAPRAGRAGVRFARPEVSTGVMSTHNMKAIYDLLTPSQEIKMKRLGYINYSDLNSKQRALLGVITDESWTISFKSDKVNITIKSDH